MGSQLGETGSRAGAVSRSVLGGTSGGFEETMLVAGGAVLGVCAGFMGLCRGCAGVSVPGHSKICARKAGLRLCGAGLGLVGLCWTWDQVGVIRVHMGLIPSGSLLQGTLFPPSRVTLGHSCFSQGTVSLP